MFKLIKRQSAGRIIALGFALVILIGSGLLMLPCSIQDGVSVRYIDALYTSTSAVCVTGLIAIDAGDTFTPLGQFFLAMLIQIGGLGVTAVGRGRDPRHRAQGQHEGPQHHPRGDEPRLRQGARSSSSRAYF